MPKPLWTQEFVGMSLSSFFQYMTHYALIVALPVFVIDRLHGSDWQAGLAMTFFQIGAVLCRPLAGKWIDQFDKKTMLFIPLGIFVLVSFLYLGVGGLYFLLAIRLLHGAVFATGTTTVATMATLVVPPHRKGEGIGYFAMFSNLAMVVGPFFGLMITAHYQSEALFAGCIVLAVLSFWCGNRKSPPVGELARQPERSLDWSSFIEPKAVPMALIGGLLFFAYAGVLVFVPLYAKLLNLVEYTSAFFAVFALVIVATRPIVGKLFDQAGANAVVYPGFAMFVLGLIAISRIQGLIGFLAAAIIIGVGFGALSPALQTLAIHNSPGQRAGVATATYFLALDISVGLGSFILSMVASYASYRAMYLCSAVVVCIAAAVYHILRQPKTVIAGMR